MSRPGFATSRTPVREALLELSYDGLVKVAPRSGVTVIGISPEDVLDSFTILGVLTGQAAAWAARRVTPEGIARLRDLAADLESNWDFHREIHRAAHSKTWCGWWSRSCSGAGCSAPAMTG